MCSLLHAYSHHCTCTNVHMLKLRIVQACSAYKKHNLQKMDFCYRAHTFCYNTHCGDNENIIQLFRRLFRNKFHPLPLLLKCYATFMLSPHTFLNTTAAMVVIIASKCGWTKKILYEDIKCVGFILYMYVYMKMRVRRNFTLHLAWFGGGGIRKGIW